MADPLRDWEDWQLAQELRFRLRFEHAGSNTPINMHSQILCEAVARILERLQKHGLHLPSHRASVAQELAAEAERGGEGGTVTDEERQEQIRQVEKEISWLTTIGWKAIELLQSEEGRMEAAPALVRILVREQAALDALKRGMRTDAPVERK